MQDVLFTFSLRAVSTGNVLMQIWELQFFRMKNLNVRFYFLFFKQQIVAGTQTFSNFIN